MLVKIILDVKIPSVNDVNAFYCSFERYCPKIFPLLEEREYSFMFRRLKVTWTGKFNNNPLLDESIFEKRFSLIFKEAKVKKGSINVFVGDKHYCYSCKNADKTAS